jgi:hypothetical protein
VQLPRVMRRAARLSVIIAFSTRIKIRTLEKRSLSFYDPKLKIRLYRTYLFHALFLKAMLKLTFRNLGRTLPIRSLRYRISSRRKLGLISLITKVITRDPVLTVMMIQIFAAISTSIFNTMMIISQKSEAIIFSTHRYPVYALAVTILSPLAIFFIGIFEFARNRVKQRSFRTQF